MYCKERSGLYKTVLVFALLVLIDGYCCCFNNDSNIGIMTSCLKHSCLPQICAKLCCLAELNHNVILQTNQSVYLFVQITLQFLNINIKK